MENVEKSTDSTAKPFAYTSIACGKAYTEGVYKGNFFLRLRNYVATEFSLFFAEIPSKSSVFRDLLRNGTGRFGFMP